MRRLITGIILFLLLSIPCNSSQETQELTLDKGVYFAMGYVFACLKDNIDRLPPPKRKLQLEGTPIPQIFVSSEDICPRMGENKNILACTIYIENPTKEDIGYAIPLTNSTNIIMGFGTEEQKYPNTDKVFITLMVLKIPFNMNTLRHEFLHYFQAYYFGELDAAHESFLWDTCDIEK